MSCFECKLLVDGTQEEMILNRKDIAGDIQNFACNNILPSNMTASCNNFMSMYLPTVVQMTIQQVTAKGVCMANKCCPNDSLSTYSKLSFNEIQTKKCEITKTLEQYVNANLAGSPVPKFFELKLLDMVCEAAFSFFKPMCQSLVEKIAPVLINVSVELAGKGAYHKALHC